MNNNLNDSEDEFCQCDNFVVEWSKDNSGFLIMTIYINKEKDMEVYFDKESALNIAKKIQDLCCDA